MARKRFDGERPRGGVAAAGIIGAAAALYLLLLLTSQAHADGDESVVGVMAKHIMVGRQHPLMFYGQPYGGGAALEALLAVLPFRLFGVSSVSLKLVAVSLSLVTLLLLYRFVRQAYGPRVGLVATAVYAFAVPLLEWHSKIRGGYVGIPLFTLALLLLYQEAIAAGTWTIPRALIFGLLFGMAYYNLELVLPFLLVLGAMNLVAHLRLWSVASGAVFVAGVVTGLGPLIFFNVTHSWSNLKHIMTNGMREPALVVPGKIHSLFAEELPRFFQARNVDAIVAAPLSAWIEYLVYLGLITWFLAVHLAAPLLAQAPGRRWSRARQVFGGSFPSVLIACMIGAFLLVYACSNSIKASSRYLLPVFPLLVILAAAALGALWTRNTPIARGAALTALGCLLLRGLAAHLEAIGKSEITENVRIQLEQTVDRMTDGDAPRRIREYLESRSVRYASCSYGLQWRLIFESDEAIIASSRPFGGWPRFAEYDLAVRRADRVATILHREDFRVKEYLSARAREFDHAAVADYVVFTPKVDRDVR